MILLWGKATDPQVVAVRAALKKHRRAAVLVDQDAPGEAQIELSIQDRISGSLRVAGQKADLTDVRAAFVRSRDPREAPEVRLAGGGSDLWDHAVALDEALRVWTEVTKARVIHPPALAARDASSPLQTRLVEALGLRSPATLVTTDPSLARAFHERHGEVVYKSISAARSRVSRLTKEKLANLDLISRCPTQFQEHVDGVDHRVHVIGEEVFATVLEHDGDDRRTAVIDRRLEPRDVPVSQEDSDRFRKVARGLHLDVVGIDLRRTPAGEWVFLEVIPAPAFARYDSTPGRLADRVARLLIADPTHDRRPS